MCLPDGQDSLSATLLESAVRDPHPAIRRHALRLAESRWNGDPELLKESVRLADDPNAAVRLQAACSWGESKSAEAGRALARVAIRDAGNQYIRAAVFSTAEPHFDPLAQAALAPGVLLDDVLNQGDRRTSPPGDQLAGRRQPGMAGVYIPSQAAGAA